jgi:hypothetical protein
LILLFVAGILLFVGCASLAQDLSGCYSKCSELCTLAKQNNFTLDGYNQITLTKQQGNVKVYCGCPCT